LLIFVSVVLAVVLAVWTWGRRRGIGLWRAAVAVLFGLYLALVLARTGERPGGAHGGLRRDRPTSCSQPAGRPERGRTRNRRERMMPTERH
jgi:hypothetical protein